MSGSPSMRSSFLLHPDPLSGDSSAGGGSAGGGSNQGGGDSDNLWINNERETIDAIQDRVVNAAEHFGYSSSAQFALRLAIEEAIINAFKHGHRGLPPETKVHVEFEVSPTRIYFMVEDQGPGFTPELVPDPTLDENLERPSGRGLVLMRAYMTRVEYNDRGNRVEMELHRPESGSTA